MPENENPWNLNRLVEDARAAGHYVERLLKRLGFAIKWRGGANGRRATTEYRRGDVEIRVIVKWHGEVPDSD